MGHLKFKIIARDKHTKARTGLLELKHGIIKTPEFMPVATKASVKALTLDDLIKLSLIDQKLKDEVMSFV